MARPRKDGAGPAKLSGGQAAYVLERMLKERRVLQSDVNRYVSEMSAEIGQLEERLRSLRDAVGGAASAAAAGIASAASSAVAAVRGRKPGRPPGSGRGPGRPPGSGRGPGRPAGSGRKPGRPAKAAAAASSSPAATEGASSSTKAAAPAKGAKRGRKTPITSEQLASRQLQGRYLALVRRFPANRRAAFARTAKEKGREAAIREMQDSLPKK